MAVIRVEKNTNYTCMANYHLRDKELSLKAKGLLSVILSLPDDWKYSMAGLVAICKEGESAVKAAFKELEKAGYVTVAKLYPNQTDTGRIEYVYTIRERPQQDDCKQDIENLGVESQGIENRGQLNTDRQSTKKSSTKESKKERKKEPASPLPSYDELIEAYTRNDELRDALREFVRMRAFIKAPMTNRAFTNMLSKLNKLGKTDQQKIDVLNQSIENNWKGIFKIHEDEGVPVSKRERRRREELERHFSEYNFADRDGGTVARQTEMRFEDEQHYDGDEFGDIDF